MPRRIQFKRQKGFRLPPGARRVTRPSKYGNPFVIGARHTGAGDGAERQIDRALAMRLFEEYVRGKSAREPNWLAELRGLDLACFCPLADRHNNPVECHADVLLACANDLTLAEVREENKRRAGAAAGEIIYAGSQ